VLNARDSVLHRNRAFGTMRAVNVEGGRGNLVERQLAERCDSGVVIEGAAADATVEHSWLHDCRVGVLVWGAESVRLHKVAVSAPRDHAVVSDVVLDVTDCELDGDVWVRPWST
jgi:nitrous oxidase accessory protein NosD